MVQAVTTQTPNSTTKKTATYYVKLCLSALLILIVLNFLPLIAVNFLSLDEGNAFGLRNIIHGWSFLIFLAISIFAFYSESIFKIGNFGDGAQSDFQKDKDQDNINILIDICVLLWVSGIFLSFDKIFFVPIDGNDLANPLSMFSKFLVILSLIFTLYKAVAVLQQGSAEKAEPSS